MTNCQGEKDERTRVLHYSRSWECGGVEKVILNICKYVDSRRYVMEVVTFFEQKNIFAAPLEATGAVRGILAVRSSKWIPRFVLQVASFYRVVKVHKPDIVHVHGGIGSEYLFVLAAKMAKANRIVLHSHNSMKGQVGKAKAVAYGFLKRCGRGIPKAFVACSQSAAEWLFTPDCVKKSKFHLIKNGIDAEEYQFDESVRKKYRQQLGLDGFYTIGTVGRISVAKNPLFLLDILRALRAKHAKTKLMMVGDGDLMPELRERIEKEGLQEQVLLLGNRPDIPELLFAMDAFVLPSKYEGFAIVAIEAQAAGLKTVVSRAVPKEAYLTDLIQKVSTEESAEAWAEALLPLAGGYKRENMIHYILDSGYSSRQSMQELQKTYDSVML